MKKSLASMIFDSYKLNGL